MELSPGTVRNYLRRVKEAGLTWPLPEDLTDEALGALLFPEGDRDSVRPQPDWAQVQKQLSRKADDAWSSKAESNQRVRFGILQFIPAAIHHVLLRPQYRVWQEPS